MPTGMRVLNTRVPEPSTGNVRRLRFGTRIRTPSFHGVAVRLVGTSRWFLARITNLRADDDEVVAAIERETGLNASEVH